MYEDRKRNSCFRIAAVLQSTVTVCRLLQRLSAISENQTQSVTYLPITIPGIIRLKGKDREHGKNESNSICFLNSFLCLKILVFSFSPSDAIYFMALRRIKHQISFPWCCEQNLNN